jgi:RecA/RadA recombinase
MNGAHAKLVNRMMRAIQAGFNSLGTDNERKPTVILINQIREKWESCSGQPNNAGRAGAVLCFEYHVEVLCPPSEKLCESAGDKKQVGQQIRFNVEKNKTFSPLGVESSRCTWMTPKSTVCGRARWTTP